MCRYLTAPLLVLLVAFAPPARAGDQDNPGAATAVVGLLAGPHIVLVGAEGHAGRAMRVVLEEGETREIRVGLPRR